MNKLFLIVTLLVLNPNVTHAKPKKKFEILETTSILERNKPCQLQVRASGGSKPYTFSATSLPAGFTITTEGVIRGVPEYSAHKDYISVTATDARGKKISRGITLRTTGESYDLSFSQRDDLAPCYESSTSFCPVVDFTFTNISYAPPIEKIQFVLPDDTQAGIILYKDYSPLNVTKDQSYSLTLTLPHSIYFISISGNRAGSTKSYVLKKALDGKFVVTDARERSTFY